MTKGATDSVQPDAESRSLKKNTISDNDIEPHEKRKSKEDTGKDEESTKGKSEEAASSSTGKSLSGKRGTTSFAKSARKKPKVNCTTCRDIFNALPSVYEGHVSGSPLCPNRDFYLTELKGKTADQKKKSTKKKKAELLQVSN